MPKLAVTMIENIVGAMATTDGRYAVLQARTADDTVVALGVPQAELGHLIDHCAFAHSECERAHRTGVDLTATASWWNGTVDPQSGDLTLALTFGKGGEQSFVLTEQMARALLATLADHYGGAESPVHEKSRRTSVAECLLQD